MEVYIVIETSFDIDWDVHENQSIIGVFFSEKDANEEKSNLEKIVSEEDWGEERMPVYRVEKHYAK